MHIHAPYDPYIDTHTPYDTHVPYDHSPYDTQRILHGNGVQELVVLRIALTFAQKMISGVGFSGYHVIEI